MSNLVWIDLETSGFEPGQAAILAAAVVVTTPDLEILWSTEAYFDTEDPSDWENQEFHKSTGFLQTWEQAEKTGLYAFFDRLELQLKALGCDKPLMCGNSVHFDRAFLQAEASALELFFSHRNLDVSVVRELCKLWAPELVYPEFQENAHHALSDCLYAIESLKHYRKVLW